MLTYLREELGPSCKRKSIQPSFYEISHLLILQMVVTMQTWLVVVFCMFLMQNQVLVISKNLTCTSDDLRGLAGFMNGLESGIHGWWHANSSSLSCCNWEGITCDLSSGRIVRLELPMKRLTGSLSNSISNLDQLKTLNISHNFLKGPIPISFFHLSNLEVVDFSGNNFNGVLPVSIHMPALRVLDISDNSFVGSFPSGLCVNSSRIQFLIFDLNHFNGVIPPGFQNCNFLEHLSMASNFLTGVIPDFLFLLPRLRELSLQNNMFTAINEIGNSSQLVRLDVSHNRVFGKIPDFFHNFPNLSYFSVRSNNMSGGIPLSLSNSQIISYIDLKNNSLTGPIDFNCSMMVNLTSLDLGSNKFSGRLPANLASCRKLKVLNVARNKLLTGQIPESFKNFESLSYLSLSNCSFNNLSKALKILQHCSNLTVLVLTMNFYDEQLPFDDDLQFKELKALVIANCRLTGSIPLWLIHSTHLQLLDLSWNELTGTIPAYLGDFKFLFHLDLSNNSLSGEIPKNLTQLQSLVSRDFSFEQLSMDLPFLGFKYIMSGKLLALQYNQLTRFPPRLDLSSNLLTGPILFEFGNLKMLHVLDLKHNNLSGTIPSSLSGMRSLETLDLSHNRLTGSIPPSLMNLTFLSKFSVAYNNLTGIIPYGGQFITFSISSFEGNPGLCGCLCVEYIVKCHKDEEQLQADLSSEDNEVYILRLVAVIGFATGSVTSVIISLILPMIK
ncbi:hypothetical protein R6Q57_012649 [Mikania cordata]